MKSVRISLLQHWKDALRSCSGVCDRVYRFLVRFYGERASGMAYPPTSVPAALLHLDTASLPGRPKSPEQIRSLLIRIAEAVHRSAPDGSW